ncbi:DUF5906 domain-containing protein [Microcoleus sp. N3A4]|uniref:DUF5906 domain-containing protein n=1 Tax=Microcoleus sp. N3A4 TaxID=3055379 RepID=UPI002FD5FA71
MYNNSTPDNGQTSNSPKKFDIRDHLDKLEPGKAKNYYICPVCEGHSLGINSKNGKYQCWTNACSTADIREAIRPLAEFLAECKEDKPAPQAKKPKAKKKEYRPVPVPIGAKLLRLPAPGKPPRTEQPKYFPKGVPDSATQITYAYSDTQKVLRFDWSDASKAKGRDKTCRQIHIDPSGKEVWSKGDARWPAYRIEEVIELLEALPDSEPVLVLMLEGEDNVDRARSIGIAGLTLQGSNWSHPEIQIMLETLQATGKNVSVAVLRDNDDAGIKKGQEVWLVARHIQFPCAVVDPRVIYPDIPEAGDIREILEAIDGEEFIRLVEEAVNDAATELTPNISLTPHPRTREEVVCQKYDSSENDYIPDTAPPPEQNFVQKAESALYSEGHWASIGGLLYQFTGTYYEERPEKLEKRRIRDWLNTYSEKNRNGIYVCNRAKSGSIDEIFNWVVLGRAVDIKEVNPPGLNCSNGVVIIHDDGSHSLVRHSPDRIYTYVGCNYDPNVNPSDCKRLLECLEPSEREIILRTFAASLCLPLIRLKMSRVKGLLLHGEGSNGKDTLRIALLMVLGRGVTGKTLKDFQIYDTGRKFPLAGLENSLCNWSSENSDTVKLDKLQSLKQFITGDELTIEHKGRGEYPYEPQATFLANCNAVPSISSDAEAIRSRYCIVSFKKTYAVGADTSKGQLEAEPRLKSDKDFVLKHIAPAMLNMMLARIPAILAEGIDYGSGDAALREAQEKSNHLWQFMRDRGYEVGKGDRLYAKDAWFDLVDWYIETGTLEVEYDREGKEKRVWNELPGRDTPVKAINQLFARLSELVPNLEKYRHTERGFESERTMGDFYYIGLTKQKLEKSGKSAPASPAVDTAKKSPPAVLQQEITAGAPLEQTILTQQAAGDAGALNPTILDFCNSFSKLSDSDKQKLTELLTGVPCSDPLKAFRVGDKVAGNKPEDSSYNWHGRIVEIHTSISCKVDWQEREKHKGGRIISMLFCDLRKI